MRLGLHSRISRFLTTFNFVMKINTAKTDGKWLFQSGLVVAVLLSIALFIYSCSSSEKIRKQEEQWIDLIGERNNGRVEFKIDAFRDSTVRATYYNLGPDTVILSTLGSGSYYFECSSFNTRKLRAHVPHAPLEVDSTKGMRPLKIISTYFPPNLFYSDQFEHHSRLDMILPFDSVRFIIPLLDHVQSRMGGYEDLLMVQVPHHLGFNGVPRKTIIYIQDTLVSNCIQIERD